MVNCFQLSDSPLRGQKEIGSTQKDSRRESEEVEQMKEVALITGASRGIGRETAVQFARAGWRVAVHYHQSAREAEELVDSLRKSGQDAIAVQADVSSREEALEMIRQVERGFGPIGVLVNNAGIAQQKLFTDITEDEWERMFRVMVNGAFHCCQGVLPGMLARREGSIVNISSIWGMVGASCEVHYSAAKAALIGMTRALAKELGPSGIRVNCVAPGVIATDMCAGLGEETLEALREETPLERIGTPAEVARAILFLAGPDAGFITGQVLSPNGGFVI